MCCQPRWQNHFLSTKSSVCLKISSLCDWVVYKVHRRTARGQDKTTRHNYFGINLLKIAGSEQGTEIFWILPEDAIRRKGDKVDIFWHIWKCKHLQSKPHQERSHSTVNCDCLSYLVESHISYKFEDRARARSPIWEWLSKFFLLNRKCRIFLCLNNERVWCHIHNKKKTVFLLQEASSWTKVFLTEQIARWLRLRVF